MPRMPGINRLPASSPGNMSIYKYYVCLKIAYKYRVISQGRTAGRPYIIQNLR